MKTLTLLAASTLWLSSAAMAGNAKVKEFGVVADAIGFGPTSAETPSNANHPSNLACIGVLAQRREGVKLGMEFLGCGGDRPGVGGFYGGGRLHWGGLLGPVRLGGGAGLGLGGLNDRSDLTGNRWSTFLYVKPGLTAGFQLAGVGVEVEAFSFLPVHLVQVISQDATPYRTATPGVGARVAVMFGKSPRKVQEELEAAARARKAREEAIKAAAARERAAREEQARRHAEDQRSREQAERRAGEQADRPLAVPAPTPEPPPRERSQDGPPDDQPLAIPAGPY